MPCAGLSCLTLDVFSSWRTGVHPLVSILLPCVAAIDIARDPRKDDLEAARQVHAGGGACRITSVVAAMDLVAPGTAVIVETEFDLGLAQQELPVGAGRVRCASPRSPCGQVNIDDGVAEGGDDSSRGKLRLAVL
jgi:hypothetical protein